MKQNVGEISSKEKSRWEKKKLREKWAKENKKFSDQINFMALKVISELKLK